MNRYIAAALAVTTGGLGWLAAPKPVPYQPDREVVTNAVLITDDNWTVMSGTADCPTGKVVVGGGYRFQPQPEQATFTNDYPRVADSYPLDSDSWTVDFVWRDVANTIWPYIGTGQTTTLTAFAVCVNPA